MENQQKQICVAVSRGGSKLQRNKCITSPGKQGQNYVTMSRLSKTKIAFYMGLNTAVKSYLGVRSFVLHSHCSVSGISSVSCNLKTTDTITCK